ncbi:PSP1 domain-containing protein [Riemerella columbipharyngis]|uniref:Cell fate regulator YaaT, PSP1 superfamily (Controls sporulation, competence, biofilm development) n=1 Tax=Riemerella columbipharyngis TaxID=1071918 RepID=A0A1G7EL59_9FLAO|nr:regulatory iron-sulfur-containing complex subunit RicT [Riemerella columbipharyngis]SDE64155.1 Cell fate regulator YaaT, PSP1 superfamily (controls sporulation, competence, biofilm development) [Riemerella columbipharyngis]
MSCGCKSSGSSQHNCGTKSVTGCASVDTCGNSYKLSVFDWLSNISSAPSASSEFVEVRFKNERKCFFRNVYHLPVSVGSVVTVEGNPGHDIGVVSLTGELVKIQMKKKNAKEEDCLKIYRIANQKDIDTWKQSRSKEEDVKVLARKIAQSLRLEMKISDVEFQGDGTKVTFYYTAKGRVDFRQLIKEYAAAFRTRIDMKQIGFRQEAAKIGGIGSCGRELCCSTWLTDFRSVNTNAARYQQLSINPQKLAGQCGKLKCCLNFELESYLDALDHFPSTNTTLQTEKGEAFCIKIDVFKQKMWFTYVGNSMLWYDLDIDEVKRLVGLNKKGEKLPPLEELRAPSSNEFKSVDLIQENSVDRFEKPQKNKRKNNKRPDKNGKPQEKRENTKLLLSESNLSPKNAKKRRSDFSRNNQGNQRNFGSKK